MSESGHHVADCLDECRLSGARNSRDADPDRSARVGQATFDDLLSLSIMIGSQAFDKGDGLRKDGNVALKNTLHVFVGGETMPFYPAEVGIHHGRLRNAPIDGECAVVFFAVLVFKMFHFRRIIGLDEDTKFILTDHHKLDLFLFVFANRRKRIIFALRPADLPSGPTGCSAVRLAHLLWEQGVLSSNLSTPTWKRA